MPQVLKSKRVIYRYQLAKLCNVLGIKVAIEVGTDQGVYASQFMHAYEGDHLFCIDNYVAYEWNRVQDRLPDLLFATQNLAKWSLENRVRIIRGNSPDIATCMPNWVEKHLGFVYIDASHDYKSVKLDLEAWWPTLTSNGILAGHDYDKTHPGVIEAVNEFAEANDRTVHVIPERLGTGIPSWYLYKAQNPDNYEPHLG